MRFPFHFRLLSCVCVKLFSHILFWKVRNSFWEPTLSPYLMMQNEGEVDPEKYCRGRASRSPWQPPAWRGVFSLLPVELSPVSASSCLVFQYCLFKHCSSLTEWIRMLLIQYLSKSSQIWIKWTSSILRHLIVYLY